MASLVKNVLLGLSAIVAGNVLLMHVLETNARAGVYHPHGDTIFIPIASSWIISTVLILAGFIAILFRRRGSWISLVGTLFGAATCLLLALVSLAWASPNHVPISVFYGLVAIWFGTLSYEAFGFMPINKSRLQGAFGAGRRNRRPSLKRYALQIYLL